VESYFPSFFPTDGGKIQLWPGQHGCIKVKCFAPWYTLTLYIAKGRQVGQGYKKTELNGPCSSALVSAQLQRPI